MGAYRDGGAVGGGLRMRTPPDEFEAAGAVALAAARDAAITNVPAALAEFDADPNLVCELTNTTPNPDEVSYQARRAGRWVVVTNIVRGARGPGPSDAQLTARVKPFAVQGGPVVPQSEVDPAITRDAEITRSFLLGIIGWTQAQLDAVFIGAAVTGSGADRVITIQRKEGVVRLPVPDADGGGGAVGAADGVVTGVAFSADGMSLRVTRSVGGELVASIPAVLRQAGLSQAQVQALIDAAEADDLDAADVAAQIASSLAGYRELPSVVGVAVNTVIEASQRGDTILVTGAAELRISLPDASGAGAVPDGWEVVVANGSSENQDIAPDGTDTINGHVLLTLPAGEAVRLQKVGLGAWRIVADTRIGDTFDPSSGIPDNSIAFAKILAGTAAQKAGWRSKIGSAHIGAGNDLPALADHNIGDVWIIAGNPTPGALSFVDIHDPGTPLDTANPFDVMMVFPGGRIPKIWTRVGTIGGINPAVQTALDAKLDREGLPFLGITHVPAGIAGGDNAADYPDVLDLVFSEKLTRRTITGVTLTLDGGALPLSDATPISGIDASDELRGMLRFELSNASKINLASVVSRHGRLYASAQLTLTFSEGDPHVHDFAWPLKNPAFRTPARFEADVGASPAVLPVGSHEISIVADHRGATRTQAGSKRLLLSQIPAADQVFYIRLEGSDGVAVRMRYAPGTRTLTWSKVEDRDIIDSFKVIGVA